MKGIFFSVVASVIGAASKLAIRKSWLMEEDLQAAAEAAFLAEAAAAASDEEEASGSCSRRDATSGINISNPNEPSEEAPPDDGLAIVNNNTEDDDEDTTNNMQPHHSNRKRGKSIYTAVQSAGGATSTENIPDQTEIESTPSSTSTAIIRRRRCCTTSKLLRLAGMFGMTFVNPAFCVLAMNYASPSILAPFSGLTLVWVIVLSRPMIGESPTMSQKIASTLIVLGEVMVAMFGDHTNDQDTSIADVEASYRELPFVLYFVGFSLFMLLISIWISSPKTSPTFQRFGWGASGGTVTGVAQCFIKDSLVVLKKSTGIFSGPWYLPLFIFLGMAFSFIGLLFLTATMKRYDATYSAAMFVGSFVVSASIMSVAHYHTFEHLNGVMNIIMYPFGLLTLMVGVHILVHRGTQTHTSPTAVDAIEGSGMDGDDHHIVIVGDGQYEPPAQPNNNGGSAISNNTLPSDTQPTASTVESDDMELI